MTLRPPRRGFSISRQLSERARANADAARSADRSGAGDPDIVGAGGFAGMVGALRGLVEHFAAAAYDQADAQAPASGGHAGGPDFTAAGPDTEATQGSQRTVTLGGDDTRMVFGYTLRMGREGISAERFGNMPAGASGKAADTTPDTQPAVLLPIVDVFEDGDTVVVVAELPGADPERIVCRADGLHLLIEATGIRRYRKNLPLPVPVQPDGIVQSFRNGILEVRMARAVPA